MGAPAPANSASSSTKLLSALRMLEILSGCDAMYSTNVHGEPLGYASEPTPLLPQNLCPSAHVSHQRISALLCLKTPRRIPSNPDTHSNHPVPLYPRGPSTHHCTYVVHHLEYLTVASRGDVPPTSTYELGRWIVCSGGLHKRLIGNEHVS